MDKEKQGTGPKKRKRNPSDTFTVTESCGLLDFLLRNLSNKSRNHVKSLLTHREVLVDGQIITQHDYPLKAGQTIRLAPSLNQGRNQKDILDILYEDNDLIVINKPAGMLSISTDQEKEHTAYHLLTDYVKQTNPKGRVFAVHRLDRDTSGVFMVAKSEEIKLALQNNWSDLVSVRGYIAIVEGKLNAKSGTIRSWLKETKTLLMYSSGKAGDGLEAITDYEVIKETADYSLLKIQLRTGRKNQIRVHMKDIGHPVAGDKKYGAETDPLKRLGLHAYKLELEHPFSHERLCFETEMPQKFKALMSSFDKI